MAGPAGRPGRGPDDQRADHAVVIGGSMAGLMAAAAMAGRFRHVTVLDRDSLPDAPAVRGGVPQGRHTHGLLARGHQALEQLFPGLGDDLVGLGAARGDLQADGWWLHDLRPLARGRSGLVGLAVSRPLMEWYVRQRVLRLGVDVVAGRSVLGLLWDRAGRRVTGVRVADRDGVTSGRAGTTAVEADLVVDASGRTSRLTGWLAQQGCAEPPVESLRMDLTYATRAFRRTPGDLGGALSLVAAASADVPRTAAVVAQEGRRWSVSIGGYHGECPPVGLAEFRREALRYGGPLLAELVATAEPLDDGASYRFATGRWHRFDRVRRLPGGVVAVGDAVCSFDPVYGQGMSVAAVEALELRRAVDQGVDGVAARFFRRTAPTVRGAWTVAGGSATLPGAARPAPLPARATRRYLDAYLQAAEDDAGLARAFIAVANLESPPTALMAPSRAARVARARSDHSAGRAAPDLTSRRGGARQV